MHAVDMHAKAPLSSVLHFQPSLLQTGGLRTAVLPALLFELITSCNSSHRVGLDARPVLATASASGPSAKGC